MDLLNANNRNNRLSNSLSYVLFLGIVLITLLSLVSSFWKNLVLYQFHMKLHIMSSLKRLPDKEVFYAAS